MTQTCTAWATIAVLLRSEPTSIERTAKIHLRLVVDQNQAVVSGCEQGLGGGSAVGMTGSRDKARAESEHR